MPLTKTGSKVKAAMRKEYGAKKGESVFYASMAAHKPGSAKWEGGRAAGKPTRRSARGK